MRTDVCRDPEIAGLLPWYVNNTLTDEERHRVEEHMAACGPCRQEVRMLTLAAEALREEVPEPRADLFARTVPRLVPHETPGLLAQVRQLLAPIPTYARVALAAQLAVIVIMAGALVSNVALTTLSGPAQPEGPAVRLQVVFSKTATAAQIQDALVSLRARIVDGPTAGGVFMVDVPLGPGGLAATGEEARSRLRDLPVVDFAEIAEERR